MDIEGARKVIYNHLTTEWLAEYPLIKKIHMENHTAPDFSKFDAPFLGVQIMYQPGRQLHMSKSNPAIEYEGHIYLTVYCPEGDGTLLTDQYLDFLTTTFKTKTVNLVTFKVPYPIPPTLGLGWVRNTLKVPFRFDTLQ